MQQDAVSDKDDAGKEETTVEHRSIRTEIAGAETVAHSANHTS